MPYKILGGFNIPIDKDEFDRGKKDGWVAKRVVSFLEKNKNKAFNIDEIMRGIGYEMREDNLVWEFLGFWAFNNTLDHLVKDGRIVNKKVDFNDYYMIK